VDAISALLVLILRTAGFAGSCLADGVSYGANPAVSVVSGRGTQVVDSAVARDNETSDSVFLDRRVSDWYRSPARLL